MTKTVTLPDNAVTHSACGRTWQLVTGTRKAHLIRPDGDLWSYGGVTVDALQAPDNGGPFWSWTWRCPCGHPELGILGLDLPASDRRPCRLPGCRKAVTNETLGYTRSGRDGGSWMSCPCCGQQGSHLVPRDPSLPRPRCYS
jgi:hypothetical protein